MKNSIKFHGNVTFSFDADSYNSAEDLANDPKFIESESGIEHLVVTSVENVGVFETEDAGTYEATCTITGEVDKEEELDRINLI